MGHSLMEVNMWQDNKRTDGVEVTTIKSGPKTLQWMIVHPNGQVMVDCPCCGKGLMTDHIAKLVADAVFPPQLDIE